MCSLFACRLMEALSTSQPVRFKKVMWQFTTTACLGLQYRWFFIFTWAADDTEHPCETLPTRPTWLYRFLVLIGRHWVQGAKVLDFLKATADITILPA